ncbi:hypothetical protein BN133_2539 [Cronobacter dublinensis 582]|nr:hypothetical protein BN133_2539 [Cronobacter dublinensis 582]
MQCREEMTADNSRAVMAAPCLMEKSRAIMSPYAISGKPSRAENRFSNHNANDVDFYAYDY